MQKRFCILQAIKNWRRRRPGNEATMNTVVFPYMKELRFQAIGEMTSGVQTVTSAAADPVNYLYCAS